MERLLLGAAGRGLGQGLEVVVVVAGAGAGAEACWFRCWIPVGHEGRSGFENGCQVLERKADKAVHHKLCPKYLFTFYEGRELFQAPWRNDSGCHCRRELSRCCSSSSGRFCSCRGCCLLRPHVGGLLFPP